MVHDGVGDTEVDVGFLSDRELADKLRQLGANIGPITGKYSSKFICILCVSVMLTFEIYEIHCIHEIHWLKY